MHFQISKKRLPVVEPRYLHTVSVSPAGIRRETTCVMGQILEQLGYKLLIKDKGVVKPIRLPSELQQPLGPFSRLVRGQFVDDIITIKLLQLPYPFPPEKLEEVAELLKPWGHTVELVD